MIPELEDAIEGVIALSEKTNELARTAGIESSMLDCHQTFIEAAKDTLAALRDVPGVGDVAEPSEN